MKIKNFLLLILVLVMASLQAHTSEGTGDSLEIEDRSYVNFIDGSLYLSSDEAQTWADAQVGDELSPGYTVRTAGDSRATIMLAGSAIVRIKPDTVFTVPRDDSNSKERISFIEMVTGFLFARAKKQHDSLKIATPNAICGVRGTEFIVEVLDDSMTEVSVLDGEVGLRNRDPKLLKNLVMLTAARGSMVRGGDAPLKAWRFNKTAFSSKFRAFEKFKGRDKNTRIINTTRQVRSDLARLEKLL